MKTTESKTSTAKKRVASLWTHFQIRMATSRAGRIALHLLVALQTGHFLWHWRGIVRELARL